MRNKERLGLNIKRYQEIVYASDNVLSIKKRVHELYSSVPINLNAEICDLLDLEGDESLLDIGCGTGDFLIYLRKIQKHSGILFGADLTSGVFEKNKILSNQENLNINFFEGSILQLPLISGRFDVVTALHMLSHVSLKQALEESRRVLSKEGKFIATANSLHSYPHVDKYRSMAFAMMHWGQPVFTTTSFNMENMRELLSKEWPRVRIETLIGELRIPVEEFLKYFYANMLIWEPLPTEVEARRILDFVSSQTSRDAKDGYVVEPKSVGVAICTK